ncbi:LysR family transcriptional regulator [cf. Phormidesmis sp. LEGE 11477]|uniref:LysR family transcriptional regulator n=1 Tax=cf. Phormidesmis sp. LEGE 11477 TaxID=1828680 RepID=UPI00187FCDF4|nr:LysR family transcriptional regulator [cf. Phormidesmis sp. LEGE 11477]MBE9059780.1 LysR family transcriptional regulator [cf. Phormidesmis sp. LEGE 11477]
MNIFQIEVLAAIVTHGTFSDAAMHLEISQSAVSRAIASLEAELGVPLFIRGRSGARLTPVGERVIVHAHQMLDIRELIDYEVNLEKGLYKSRLRISSFRSAATHLLPANIARFRNRFPYVEVVLVELDPAGVEQSLREGQTDIGLISLPRSEEFRTVEITRDEYVVLLPKSEPPPPKDLSWEALSAYSFILFNYAECTSAVREHWEKWGQSFEVAYVIKEDSTIVSMVAQGLGAAILPRLAAMPIPDDVYVRSLPVRLDRVIGAATLASTPPAPAVKMFLDLLGS